MLLIDYVELHAHSKYSEKDAIPEPKEYAKEVKKRANGSIDSEALAITEHGHMISYLKHYLACKEAGIKAIIGCEFYVVEDTNKFLEGRKNKRKKKAPTDPVDDILEDDMSDYYHLVLLAKTEEGLKNLYRLATLAGMNKYKGTTKYFNLLEEKHLKDYGKGIICLTACVGGLIPQLILNGMHEEAEDKIIEYTSYFDELYLEVQPHEFKEQLIVNSELVELSKILDLPLVITSDAHYVNEKDRSYHNILKTMDKAKPFDTINNLKTADEMVAFCEKYNIPKEAVSNTVKIAKSCNVNPMPKDSRGLMPNFPCPEGYREVDYLRELVLDGLMAKMEVKLIDEPIKYIKQALYELDIICSMGYAGYFLILWDWIKWCREQGIMTGKGRGSAASSIVSYCLNITTIDPIKGKCVFERFLNPFRVEAPDIDSDIATKDRARAIEYLLNKYGSSNVSQIVTYSEYNLKNTIREILRTFGYLGQDKETDEKVNDDIKKLPDMIMGRKISYSLVEGLIDNPDDYEEAEEKDFDLAKKTMEALEELFNKYPEIYDGVAHLKGCIASYGMHASGVVVSSKLLEDFMPLMAGSDKAVLPVAQLNMDDLHTLNALKIDVLGLNTLTMIKECMDMVGLDFDWYDSEDYSDQNIYDMLKRGETADVFQMARHKPTQMFKDYQVNDIFGVADVNASNRPGPLAETIWDEKIKKFISMVEQYKQNKIDMLQGKEVVSIDPRIDPILKDTFGCVLYQEQVIRIAQIVAGYNAGTADIRIRKPFNKKQVELIPEIKNEFIYGKKSIYGKKNKDDKKEEVIGISEEDSPNCIGAVRNGFTVEVAEKIFDILKEFSKYSFNIPHSLAYGATAYKSAYLSYYHPVEWAVACCNHHGDNDSRAATLKLARKRGIQILPPDINKSDYKFKVEEVDGEKAIRFGFLGVKDLGSAGEFIEKVRAITGEFEDFDDYLYKAHEVEKVKDLLFDEAIGKRRNNPLDKGVEQVLIQVGAFDSIEENRYKLENYYMLDIKKSKEATKQNTKEEIQKYKLYIKNDEDKFDRKAKLAFEKEYMSTYISEHPLEPYPYRDLSEISLSGWNKLNGIEIAGKVKSKANGTTKNGKKMLTLTLEDKTGANFYARAFEDSEAYEKYKDFIKANEQVIITGIADKGTAQYKGLVIESIKKIVPESKLQKIQEKIEKENKAKEKVLVEQAFDDDDSDW